MVLGGGAPVGILSCRPFILSRAPGPVRASAAGFSGGVQGCAMGWWGNTRQWVDLARALGPRLDWVAVAAGSADGPGRAADCMCANA